MLLLGGRKTAALSVTGSGVPTREVKPQAKGASKAPGIVLEGASPGHGCRLRFQHWAMVVHYVGASSGDLEESDFSLLSDSWFPEAWPVWRRSPPNVSVRRTRRIPQWRKHATLERSSSRRPTVHREAQVPIRYWIRCCRRSISMDAGDSA